MLNKIHPNVSEQVKKQKKIYDLLNAGKKPLLQKKNSEMSGVCLRSTSSPDLDPFD